MKIQNIFSVIFFLIRNNLRKNGEFIPINICIAVLSWHVKPCHIREFINLMLIEFR